MCLNADGSPNTDPTLTNPANCGGALQANPGFDPLLACYDLTRTGPLPASDGCPNSNQRPVHIQRAREHPGVSPVSAGHDHTEELDVQPGIAGRCVSTASRKSSQAEPRLGIAYNIKPTSTVLQVSYARTLETPFNENLVLASLGCNDAVINDLQATIQGYPCLTSPLTPGFRNEFHAGLQQAFGRYLVISGEYIWKYTHNAYDFSVLGNTPITYPIEWASSKIPGYAIRASVPNFHGFTAFVVMSSVAARFFGPQVSGIGTTPSSFGVGGVFRIDHDELFNATTHLQYQIGKRGPWIGFNWRYDSGLVAGPAPCAGGNCANGPNGTDSMVDVSGLTPDQQFEAGLFCGSVHATPTTPISPTADCVPRRSMARRSSRSRRRAPKTTTTIRRASHRGTCSTSRWDTTIIFHGDRYKWSARLSIVNIDQQGSAV